MKKLLIAILLCLLAAVPARAGQATPEQCLKLLEAAGTYRLLDPIIQQSTLQMQAQYKSANPNFPARADQIIVEEFQQCMQGVLRQMLQVMANDMAPRLTTEDVDALMAFYATPTWQKMVDLNIMFAQPEYIGKIVSELLPQPLAETLTRINDRLKAEGLLDDKGEVKS